MDNIVAKGDDTLLKVRVQPRASKTSLRCGANGGLRVYVTAPPVDDAANAAVIAYLSKILKKNKTSFMLVSGHHSRDKTLQIRNISPQEVLRILENSMSSKS